MLQAEDRDALVGWFLKFKSQLSDEACAVDTNPEYRVDEAHAEKVHPRRRRRLSVPRQRKIA